MTQYLLKQILSRIPILLGITLITFMVIHLAPGKPTDLQTELNPKVSYEARQRLEKLYGLDRPLTVQYGDWLFRLMRFDFGRSFQDDRPVLEKILERIPITLAINLLSLILIFAIALPIGVLSAVKQHSLFDKSVTLFVFIGFAAPEFWIALLLMELFGVTLGWLPVSGIRSFGSETLPWFLQMVDVGKHLILPLFIAAFGSLAGLSRYMRGSMLNVIRQDYIRTARAKGLSEHVVIYKHALRNALLPVVTILGLSVPGLIGGSVIFETIFGIPGMGKLFFDGVMARDYPTLMGILVIGAVLTLLGNFLADLAYGWVDPRIRLKGEKVKG
ncbi:MAG: ABC transporter permease [Candidatus Omnitrophica bacterium]|nr:ABC transporter permease [Candidatus Omnitrophota bacterium]